MKPAITFIILLLLTFGCEREKDDYKSVGKHKRGAVNLILHPDDTGNSLLNTIKRDSIPYSDFHNYDICSFGPRIIRVDPYRGLMVYGKNDTGRQVFKFSMRVIGALYVDSLNTNKILVQSTIGEALFDFSDPDTLVPLYFRFNYPGMPPIHQEVEHALTSNYNPFKGGTKPYLYFTCPKTDEIIYGWQTGVLYDPICYRK